MTYHDTFKNFSHDNHGGVATIFALALLPMLAAAGGAVDYSMAVRARTQIQSVVDSAVLAGARQTDAASRADVAGKFAASQLTSPGLSSPSWQFKDTADGQFTGKVNARVATNLLGIIGIDSIPVEATATAGLPKGGSKVCILLLDPSRSQSLLLNSGVNLTAPDCEIHTRSTAAPAAVFNAGNKLDVKRICVKGNNVLNNAGTVPGLQTGCNTISDPFAGKLPAMASAACNYNSAAFNPGNVTLNPGVYCGYTNFNGNGTITLSPGVYVIKGGA